MNERQKLVERAKKVAALMTSPVEGEMIAASVKLKQLLTEHDLTLKELGVSDLLNNNLSHTTAKYEANKANTNNLRDVVRTSGASREVSPEADDNEIHEIIYKRPINSLEIWFLCVLLKTARVHRCWVYGDRFGTSNSRSHYLKIVGYRPDLEKLKIEIINLRTFILGQIERRGFVYSTQIVGYVFGLTDEITSRIKGEIDQNSTPDSRMLSKSKSIQLAEYMLKKYGLTSDSDPIDLDYDRGAYRVGQCDGYKYFGHSSCRDAFLEALRKKSENVMEKLG